MLEASDYTVGWICALSMEFTAAQEFLDEDHGQPQWRSPNDTNSYRLGTMGKHNVVIAVLPLGEYGTASATGVAINMLRTFSNVRIGMMVGIAGGAPSLPNRDIRLGDVVVSCPENGHGGVLQYDFGKSIQEKKFQYTRSLDQPPQALLTALAGLRTQHEREGNTLNEVVDRVLEKRPRLKRKYGRPTSDKDVLFDSVFVHGNGDCASSCVLKLDKIVKRPQREPDVDDDPTVHYGTIASGNTLMKDALIRDTLANERNVLCFEMEAAGLMNRLPCLIVRGICDYSDSHKTKEWQGFAAMVAAAYAKEVLCYLVPEMVRTESRLSTLLYHIQGATAQNKEILQGIESRQNSGAKQIILDWLSDKNFGSQQSDTFARRQPGTCQWVLDSHEYQTWVNGTGDRALHCHGIPGAGKTILSSVVVDDLETRFGNDMSVGAACFYCSYKVQLSQSLSMLVASVLKQLCQQQFGTLEVVQSLYDKHNSKETKPQIHEFRAALWAVLNLFSRVYLVVDALDEWQDTESDRSVMIHELFSLQTKTNLKLFTTSRPLEDIRNHFKVYPSLEVMASETDIGLYVYGHRQMLPSFVRNTPGLLGEINEALSEASQGMFLIAQLYLEWLKYETSIRSLKSTLRHLKNRSRNNDIEGILGNVYDETMQRIRKQSSRHEELAERVLSWAAFAMRPMTMHEIQRILAIREGDTRFDVSGMSDPKLIISVCCGLVTLEEESHIIRLVHYTADEYFKADESRLSYDLHAYLARQCTSCLSLMSHIHNYPWTLDEYDDPHSESWEEPPKGSDDSPLCEKDDLSDIHVDNTRSSDFDFGYLYFRDFHASDSPVSNSAASDIHLSDTQSNDDHLHNLQSFAMEIDSYAHKINNNRRGFRRLLQSYTLENYLVQFWGHHMRSMFKTCRKDAKNLVLEFLNDTSKLITLVDLIKSTSMTSDSPVTALQVAAYYGLDFVIEALLGAGEMTRCDDHTLEALSWAYRNGHTAATKILLSKMAGITGDRINEQFTYLGGGLLHLAAKNGDLAMIKVLMRYGARLDVKDYYGNTPIDISIIEKDTESAKWFLDALGSANEQVSFITSHNLMSQAVRARNLPFIQLMLDHGLDVDECDSYGRTGLSMVLKDIALGIDVPWYENEEFGLSRIAVWLLERGANPNCQCENGQTSLMESAFFNSVSGLRLLIEYGANLDLQDKTGTTALMVAASRGSLDCTRILIENGAALNLQDRKGKTALFHACRIKRSTPLGNEIVEFLIKSGAEVDIQDNRGQTCLMEAIRATVDIIVSIIIRTSKDLDLQDERGRTALDWTFEKICFGGGEGAREVVRRLLLEKGARAYVHPEAENLSISCPPFFWPDFSLSEALDVDTEDLFELSEPDNPDN